MPTAIAGYDRGVFFNQNTVANICNCFFDDWEDSDDGSGSYLTGVNGVGMEVKGMAAFVPDGTIRKDLVVTIDAGALFALFCWSPSKERVRIRVIRTPNPIISLHKQNTPGESVSGCITPILEGTCGA